MRTCNIENFDLYVPSKRPNTELFAVRHDSAQKFRYLGSSLCMSRPRRVPILIHRSKRFIAVSLVLLLQGCAFFTTPKPQRDAVTELSLPPTWASVAESNDGDVTPSWLRAFNDPELELLVAEALSRNQSLQITAANLAVAKEGMILGRAARLPSLSASGFSSLGGTKVRDLNGDLTPWFHDESYGLSLNASWEVDLWGRLRNLHQATIEDYGATEADFHGARLSLAGGIARAWFNVIAARQQVDLARWTRDEFQNSFQVVERIYKATGETALSVQFSLNNVASAERTLLARQLGLGEARRSLELLLGRYPSATIEARDKLPENILGPVPAGLPSGLLTRRPDLVAAAADLRASSERADAARKNLLPSIRLSAGGSSPSDKLANLLARPSSIAWNLAASITQPVFEGGALGAQARQAKARNDAAVQSFTSIALRAFREVESALETERSLASQEVFLGTEQAQAILAEAQALRDFTEGVGDYLPVLESQRRASNARASMISLQNQRLQTRIGLYLALGGDFEAAPDDDLAPRLASVEEPRLQTLPNEQ